MGPHLLVLMLMPCGESQQNAKGRTSADEQTVCHGERIAQQCPCAHMCMHMHMWWRPIAGAIARQFHPSAPRTPRDDPC
eukprot:1774432-Prymnesium_polylepis.1